MSEVSFKQILLTCPLSEIERILDIIRERKDIVSVETLTETDLIEMKAEDEQHFRGLVTQIRKDIANEPA